MNLFLTADMLTGYFIRNPKWTAFKKATMPLIRNTNLGPSPNPNDSGNSFFVQNVSLNLNIFFKSGYFNVVNELINFNTF